jgi:chemotaxis protein methyltransferase CheR
VVFCRNLLMYLNPATHAALIARMTGALAPGGFLFLGHTDSLGSRPAGLESRQSHHTFYYRRPTATAPVVPVIRPEPAPRREMPVTTGPDLYERTMGLLIAERFGEALAVVEAGLGDRPPPRNLLLHAVLLAHAGRLDEAEMVCRRLLDTDGLYADAHHLLAVCLEDGASAEVAIGHYRLAAYLDATFAMPRLRLGLLARRRGDHRTAHPELDRALILLRDERDERIALFGGGFGRIALTTLCRAELDAIGARR